MLLQSRKGWWSCLRSMPKKVLSFEVSSCNLSGLVWTVGGAEEESTEKVDGGVVEGAGEGLGPEASDAEDS